MVGGGVGVEGAVDDGYVGYAVDDVVMDNGVNTVYKESALRTGHAAVVAVAVGGEADGLPFATVGAVDAFGMGYAALVGDDGTDGHFVLQVVGTADNAFVKYAHGVVGGYLFGDAVDGAAAAVKGAHVDRIDGVAGVGFLEFLDVVAVPGCGRLSVDYSRETGLEDEVVDEGVVAVGAGVLLVIFPLGGEVGAVVLAGEGDGGFVVGAVEKGGVGAEGVDVAGTGAVVCP